MRNIQRTVIIPTMVLYLSLETHVLNAQSVGRRARNSQLNLPKGTHGDNFAVIVSSSRSFHNYRHASNALHFYDTLRNKGQIPDSNIVLMLADDLACNARNPHKCTISSDGTKNLYSENIQVDYRGDDVNVANFLRVLTHRHLPGTVPNRKLPHKMNSSSNLLIFLTGHGGDEFFKFQDVEELISSEIGHVIQYMHAMELYDHILFVSDTCQAFTLSFKIQSPNVLSVGSSLLKQNSYAHHSDAGVGASVIDRFSHVTAQWVSSTPSWHSKSLLDWIQTADFTRLASTVGYNDDLADIKFDSTPMSDFFVRQPQVPIKATLSADWVSLSHLLQPRHESKQNCNSADKESFSYTDASQRLYSRVMQKMNNSLIQEIPYTKERDATFMYIIVVFALLILIALLVLAID